MRYVTIKFHRDIYNNPVFMGLVKTFSITNPKFIDSLVCPVCGATECHPLDDGKILIRGFKVQDDDGDWSQCMVCAGYYNENLKPFSKEFLQHDGNKFKERGWFSS